MEKSKKLTINVRGENEFESEDTHTKEEEEIEIIEKPQRKTRQKIPKLHDREYSDMTIKLHNDDKLIINQFTRLTTEKNISNENRKCKSNK